MLLINKIAYANRTPIIMVLKLYTNDLIIACVGDETDEEVTLINPMLITTKIEKKKELISLTPYVPSQVVNSVKYMMNKQYIVTQNFPSEKMSNFYLAKINPANKNATPIETGNTSSTIVVSEPSSNTNVISFEDFKENKKITYIDPDDPEPA